MNQRIDDLRNRLRDDPGSRLFFQLGDLLWKAGELDEAESTLVAGLEYHPRYVGPWVTLGRIQLDKAQFSEAERSFARALELDPENAIAARLIGETAERVGEWVRAIKAYKLARALSPRDDELEQRIEAITERLAGGPDDISAHSTQEAFPEESDIDDVEQASAVSVDSPEPFAAGPSVEAAEEPFSPGLAPSRPRAVISVSEADPFSMTSTGNTGEWMVADDVFAPPPIPSQPTAGDVFGEEPGEDHDEITVDVPFEDPVVESASPDVDAVPETVFAEADQSSQDLLPDAIVDEAFEDDLSSEPVYAREFSMPTVTLARLALEQGDRPLAEETLQAILDRDPEHADALALRRQLSEETMPEVSEIPAADRSPAPTATPSTKAEILRGWMNDIRAAAERRVQ